MGDSGIPPRCAFRWGSQRTFCAPTDPFAPSFKFSNGLARLFSRSDGSRERVCLVQGALEPLRSSIWPRFESHVRTFFRSSVRSFRRSISLSFRSMFRYVFIDSAIDFRSLCQAFFRSLEDARFRKNLVKHWQGRQKLMSGDHRSIDAKTTSSEQIIEYLSKNKRNFDRKTTCDQSEKISFFHQRLECT